MTRLIDDLTQHHWHLFVGVLVLFLLWRVATRVVGERPLFAHFPRTVAVLDLLMLPLLVVVAGSLLRVALRAVGLTAADAPLRLLTLFAAYLALGWALARLVELWLLPPSDGVIGERVPKLIIGLIYGALLVLAGTLFLWQQGFSFAGVWVSTGVAAGVIGFAMQKTLGDLFAGIALGLERPFRLGDWIQLADGTVGQVIDLNWRATHLRGWDNATHVVPNSRMAGEPLKNLHDDRHLYAPWYFVKIPAEVDPRFATALLLDAAMRCEAVLRFPSPVVRLADASSIPYSYMVWVHLKNYPAMFRAREELFREIHRGLREAGIEVSPQVRELRTRRAREVAAEPPTIALALRGLDFADELTDAELAQIAARATYRHFDTGQVLLAEGAVSDAFYVVAGGLVDSVIRLPDASRRVVETLVPGKHFGITAMLTAEPSFLEFVANTDVTLVRIDFDCVRAVVGSRPELAERLAGVVKERLDAAEAARVQSRQPNRRLSLRDIRLGIERRMRAGRVPPP
jgi:small-conductance mechanosensitive channel/CRP-like cAMP-binding protein